MREFNALAGYPEPKAPRYVGPQVRTVKHRIVAAYRDREYYDGDRNYGYGGFRYDGRWVPIARTMSKEYGLRQGSAVLQVGCEKGFLLHDFHQLDSSLKLRGTDISEYAIAQAMESVKPFIQRAPFTALPFANQAFDLVIAIGVVYTLNLADAMTCLREIQRVGKGRSFVTLAAYRTQAEKQLFEWWTVLGATLLHEREWVEVLSHVGYTGDYKFTTARSLALKRIPRTSNAWLPR
jgi:ubiquinone/menaquinone biosynthesis C-methylase UbiE